MKISNFLQSGRSMVEMLGVLAIIGVLSVGGIAGYSKAMMKYKLNKHAESFNMLLNDALHYSSEFKKAEGTQWTYYGELFHKLGTIPDGFKYINNKNIQDNFGNEIRVYSLGLSNSYTAGIYIPLNTMQREVCQNFIKTAKENSANLYMIESQKTDTSDGSSPFQGILYGDNYCTSNRKCLKDLKIDNFEDLCDNSKLSSMIIIW